MNTYTVVCDFRGGTYVAQVTADTPSQAVETWCDQLLAELTFAANTSTVAATVREALADDRPVLLDGLTNVWCLTANADETLVLINLALTAAA